MDKETAAQLLVGKIMLDPEYLEELMRNPQEALEEIGIENPTEGMIEAIKGLEAEAVQNIAKAFEPHNIGE